MRKRKEKEKEKENENENETEKEKEMPGGRGCMLALAGRNSSRLRYWPAKIPQDYPSSNTPPPPPTTTQRVLHHNDAGNSAIVETPDDPRKLKHVAGM